MNIRQQTAMNNLNVKRLIMKIDIFIIITNHNDIFVFRIHAAVVSLACSTDQRAWQTITSATAPH